MAAIEGSKQAVIYAIVPEGVVLAETYEITRPIQRQERTEHGVLVPVNYVLLKCDRFSMEQTEEIITSGGFIFKDAETVHSWLNSAV